jgi:type IV secretion system protein VirB11
MSAEPRGVYLQSALAPLAPFLGRQDVTDLYINRPGEIWLETLRGGIERIEVDTISPDLLARLARQVAALTAQGISRAHPLLAAALPSGARIQIVIPPATRENIAIAIRKHGVASLSLADYPLDDTSLHVERKVARRPFRTAGKTADDILGQAVRERRNILVSGGTSSGKTTLLNVLLREIPAQERLIVIEDTPELESTHANMVSLVATRGALGEASVTQEDLLIAALRMRPDRIILGEIRGQEATTFLRAINTGHPGSLSTIHADSPSRAIDQLALLVLQTGLQMSWDNVVAYVRRSIDLIVQLDRVNGKRIISAIGETRSL